MADRNKYGRPIVRAEVDGYKGSAEVCWVENDGCNAPHWKAFISVPYQDSKWEHLGDKLSEAEAIDKARASLEYRLSRCTLV